MTPAEGYDGFYADKDYAAEARMVIELVDRYSPEATTLLDVACGTGKHLEHFVGRFQCEGTDLEPTMLAVAQRRLPDVRFTEGDMTTLDLGRTFDVVTCLFSSIGHSRTPEGLAAAVAALASHVNPGGMLIIEPWFTPDKWIEPGIASVEVVDGGRQRKVVRVLVSSRTDRISELRLHYVMAVPGEITTEDSYEEFGLFTPDEYVGAMEAAGLDDVTWDDHGLTGRGLVTGRRSPSRPRPS